MTQAEPQIESPDASLPSGENGLLNPVQQPVSEYSIEANQYPYSWLLCWTGILASFVAILYFTYLGIILDAWQLHIVTLSTVGLMLMAITSTILIRRGKSRGIWFFLVGGQIWFFIYSLFIDGRGLISLGCILILSSLVAVQSVPTYSFRRAINLALLFGALAGLTEFSYLPFQFVFQNGFNYIEPGLIIIVTLAFCINLVKNFRSFNTRIQLGFTVITVSLVALGIFTLVMSIFTQRRITHDYNLVLNGSAEHAAKTLDAFFTDHLNSISAESQMPVFSKFLQTPENERLDSNLQDEINITLLSLVEKDTRYITSYSLLDLKGIIQADTTPQDIGKDRSELESFNLVLESGQTTVSSIEHSGDTSTASFSFSAPVVDEAGDILGVLLVRFKADIIQDILISHTGYGLEHVYAFVLDDNKVWLAHTQNPKLRFKKDQSNEMGMQVGTKQATVYSLKTQPWQVVYAVDRSAMLAPIRELAPVTIMLNIVLLGFIAMIGLSIADLLSKPIRNLTEFTKLAIAGNMDVHAPVVSGTEAGSMAQAFNTLLAQYHLKLQGLENSIATRDWESEHHAIKFRTLAELSDTIANTRDLDELLPKIAQLISQNFGYYHVGISLLDSTYDYATLRAASGTGSEQMMARNHQIRAGEGGIIGHVINTKETYLSKHALEDDLFVSDPDLPETRSEIAVPLLVGGQVIGVLDVQSNVPHAFAQNDITILELIANQVAIAIDNARLFREKKDALESIGRAYGELSQEAWAKLLREQPDMGYLANRLDFIYTPANGWHPDMVKASQTGSTIQISNDTLAIPIKERDHVLGILRLRKPDSQLWSKDELALAETLAQQLYLALENARLYQETQQRAERERLAREITAKMRSSNDPQVILQTAIQELRWALNITNEPFSPQAAPPSADHVPPQEDASSQESE